MFVISLSLSLSCIYIQASKEGRSAKNVYIERIEEIDVWEEGDCRKVKGGGLWHTSKPMFGF